MKTGMVKEAAMGLGLGLELGAREGEGGSNIRRPWERCGGVGGLAVMVVWLPVEVKD
jgi:hypothetical protein